MDINLILMINDQYKLKDKSNDKLREWVTEHNSDTDEYNAGIEELMRRVATIEEVMERSEAPIYRRECIAAVIAMLFIAATIFVIVLTYE